MNPKKIALATVRVIATNARLGCGKATHGKKLRYAPETCLALTDRVYLSRSGHLMFGRIFRTRGNCTFNVQESGSLVFGNDVFVNSNCMFNCRRSITVGDGCEFGPHVLVYDHDHDFRVDGGLKDQQFSYGDVSIGKNCWIGAGAIILRGTVIGDGCVVGAGCILKGKYPSNTLIIQPRETSVLSINRMTHSEDV